MIFSLSSYVKGGCIELNTDGFNGAEKTCRWLPAAYSDSTHQ